MKDIKILYIKEILSGKIGNGWALESIYTSGNTKIGVAHGSLIYFCSQTSRINMFGVQASLGYGSQKMNVREQIFNVIASLKCFFIIITDRLKKAR